MLVQTGARSCGRVRAAPTPRTDIVERKLRDFRPQVQSRVRAVAGRHP